MPESSSPYPPNVQYELARERNRIAADRSLLSWVRTSLFFIGAGFGLERSLTALSTTLGVELTSTRLIKLVGIAFISLGIYVVSAAALDYRQELARLSQGSYTYVPRRSLGMTTAVILMVIAILAFVGIYWQASS